MKTVDWMTWGKAALIRGVRTFAEAMLAYIGTGALVLGDVNWVAALSAGGFGFVSALWRRFRPADSGLFRLCFWL